MRKLICVLLLSAVVAVSGFAFNWITLSMPETDTRFNIAAGYGTVFVASFLPVAGTLEMNVPLLQGLSAGGGISFTNISVSTASTGFFGLSAYAKYAILDSAKMAEIISLPLALGAAAGLGWDFALGSTSGVSSFYAGGIKGLLVAYTGFDWSVFTISVYLGLVDQGFTFSGDAYFNLSDTMKLGVFYIPLLGLGATFVMGLDLF